MDIETTLIRLKQSKFRASFHLKKNDIDYIKGKGWDSIQDHCYDFIRKRLAPAIIDNDGKQTPTHGHPVFVAQHACACCCRGCLSKWHKINKGNKLSDYEINQIVELIMSWIHKEFDNYKETKKFPPKNNKIIPIQLNLFEQ